jgi:hypothetical protein
VVAIEFKKESIEMRFCSKQLVVISSLWVHVAFTITCWGQSVNDFFPNQEVQLIDYSKFPSQVIYDRNLLGFSKEQENELRAMSARIHMAKMEWVISQNRMGQKADASHFDRMRWEEFMAKLNEEQQVKFMQVVLVQYIYRKASLVWRNPSGVRLPFQSFVFYEPVARWLGITRQQQAKLMQAKRVAEEILKKPPEKTFDEEKSELFSRWQASLYDVLLPHQQSSFDEALGENAPFMEQFYGKIWSNPELFLNETENLNINGRVTTHPGAEIGIGHLLYLTHPHIDAKIHPHAMFELLMHPDVVSDLKLKPFQIDQLKRLPKDCLLKYPLPEQMTVNFETGRSMTTPLMRESAAALERDFGMYHQEVDRILSTEQRERLRQLGNQFLMSRSWKSVPLTCPDWIGHLELSSLQEAEFSRISAEFRKLYRQLEQKSGEIARQVCRELEEKITEILTENQKQMLLDFIAIGGY